MVIFHSYVSLPEGIGIVKGRPSRKGTNTDSAFEVLNPMRTKKSGDHIFGM
jgi:hypothetical protein